MVDGRLEITDLEYGVWSMEMQLNIELVANVRLNHSPEIREMNFAECI
jgi:hypothetical protein